MATKIEFAVQMTCDSCVKTVKNSLDGIDGIKNVDINLKSGSVVVDTTLTTNEVHKLLEASGRKAVIKGLAGSVAAVSVIEFGSKDIKGVVRFVQTDPNTCIVDGTIDGLSPGEYGLFVHEAGDTSNGCMSVGDCFNPVNEFSNKGRVYGNLGLITATANGRASFRFEDNVIKLPNIIGRSLVITPNLQKGENTGKRLACGIIARSSGLFQNPKTICACDGVSIWDERNKPKSQI